MELNNRFILTDEDIVTSNTLDTKTQNNINNNRFILGDEDYESSPYSLVEDEYEDAENYNDGFSLDALERTYLKRLQEKDDDELDLEMDVLTPPKIEGYVDKETGEFVETPYTPVVTAESIEREEKEKSKQGFDRLSDAWGQLIDFGDTKEEILKNGKEMKAALLEDMGKANVRNDPIVILMANLAGGGGRGAKIFEKVINGIQLGMAGSQDILEAGLIELEEFSPSTFKAISKVIPNSDTPSNMTDEISEAIGAGAEFAETTGAFGFPQLLIRTSSHMKMKRAVNYKIKNKTKIAAAQKKFLETAKRNNINNVRHRKAEADLLIQSQADKIARVEVEIVDDLLNAMEQRVGKDLSKVDKDGIRSVDMDKVKKAGVEITEDLEKIDRRSLGVVDLSLDDADSFVMPVLKPEKFNRLVSVIKELKEKKPDVFTTRNKDGTKRNVLDNLFDLALKTDPDKPSIVGTELGDILIKYGLSYEDYMLAAIGSGSTAGKILNKLSQMVKAASPEAIARAKTKNAQKRKWNNFRRGLVRIESVRRGGLVSQLATAARNLSSGVIRAPLETMASAMDTTLLKFAEAPTYGEGIKAAADIATPFTKAGLENWKDSFALFKYTFKDQETAKIYSQFLLEQPEFKKQYDSMFETLNEIQKASGRGSGTIFDKVVSEAEDVVQALNVPNRWQELLIRRGAFFSEMERLTKREWGIDLIDTLASDGSNLRKLIGNSSEFRPKGKLSFEEMMEQSTRKALDITYAKEPERAVFRSASRFIVNNGLTVVIPFPRFMFTTMELMGNYAGGGLIPLTRFASRQVSGIRKKSDIDKLSSKDFKMKYGVTKKEAKNMKDKGMLADEATGQLDRQRITRNLQGIAVAGAAYMYRSADDAPANSYEMYIGDDAVVDVSAQWPMRQYLWVGETVKQILNGTFYKDIKNDPVAWTAEASKTFLGANFRTGQGAMLLDEIRDIVASSLDGDSSDLAANEARARLLGRAVGNYLGSWAVPAAQLIDAQRVLGERTVKFKDHSKDPTFDFKTTFMNEAFKPFSRFGDTRAEKQLPDSPYLFSTDKERVSPISKMFLGLNMYTRDEPWAEYTKKLGIKEWKIDSASKVPSVKRLENKLLKEHFPSIVNVAKRNEEILREFYRESNQTTKDAESEESYVKRNNRQFIEEQISKLKQQVRDGRFSETDSYVRAQVEYRKMTRDQKDEAYFLFTKYNLDEYGRGILPDMTNEDHLRQLKALGDMSKGRYN